jgi:hypothetical protein
MSPCCDNMSLVLPSSMSSTRISVVGLLTTHVLSCCRPSDLQAHVD